MEHQYTQDEQKAILNQALLGINGFSLSSVDSHLGIADAGMRNKVGNSCFVWPDPPSNVCHLLRLPIEVRDRIWKELFERPIGLVPGEVRYQVKRLLGRDENGEEKYKIYNLSLYSYQWEPNRQVYSEATPLPQYDGRTQTIPFTWVTSPTEEQLQLIATKQYNTTNKMPFLEPCFHPGLQSEVTPYIHQRGHIEKKVTQILNRALVNATGLLGSSVLRTCRQIEKEATEILYSTNTFVFDTEGRHPLPRPDHTSESPILAQLLVASEEQYVAGAVELLFDTRPETYRPAFLKDTPMNRFFRNIGPRNASLIRKIQLEGLSRNPEVLDDRSLRPVSFSSILQTYALILKNVCVSLRELTLDFDKHLIGRGNLQLLAIGRARRRKMDRFAVENLVETLPELRKLQLGKYQWTPSEEEWENELKLMAVVDERNDDRRAQVLRWQYRTGV